MTKPTDKISNEAMAKLARLMNDSPTLLKLKGTEWEIHCLKPGIQWLISEEACKLERAEGETMADLIRGLASSYESVCRVLSLALVNDKCVTDPNDPKYNQVYDTLMWGEFDTKDWSRLLFEIVSLLEVDFILANTGVIATFSKSILERKMTMKEQGISTAAQNGGK